MTGTKTKIAYLLEYPLDLPGGAQMSTESLCRGLAGSGEPFEALVICPHLLKKSPADYPFRVLTYDMGENRVLNLLKRMRAFKELIKAEAPDIVHVQMPESLITCYLAGIRGVKLIFTDRGLFYGYRRHTMLLMKQALKRVSYLLVTTEYNRRLWLEGLKGRILEPSRIRRVSNTISSAFGAYDENRRRELYEKRGGAFTIGMAGRICEEKNWPFAVRLIRLMAERGLKFRVALVLSVFEKGDDEKVREITEGIIEAVGEENLSFHQDLTQEQMQDYYYGVDLFVMTSRFESFGKAAVEAMSRRCAVISTDVGGLSEVIGRAENLYTESTPERAVDRMERIMGDEALLKSEQEYFYQRYLENFSQESCLKEHIKIYND